MEEKDKKTEEKATKARPTNCAKCNKQFKKKLWYYRNSKYYCTKACWKSSLKAAAQPS